MSSNSNKRAPTTATQRLKQDYLRIKKDPVPYICAEPLPSNILEWHYVVRGPELTPYEGKALPGSAVGSHRSRGKWGVGLQIHGLDFHGIAEKSVFPPQKRQLAAQSLAFNLKDKVFCELFPEVVEEIKQKQKAQEELSSRPPSLPLPDVVPDGDGHFGQNGHALLNGHVPAAPGHGAGLQQPHRNHGLLGGALANLFVIVGFAAFAYTVKYVLRSIAQE
ncbi:UB2J2 enzyme, partial [Pteruthius melanotis]|nr:UB2J2 enzyme [Pteruthius melanotis]